MWIKTQRGQLLNMGRTRCIDYDRNLTRPCVRAWQGMHWAEVATCNDEAEAQAVIQRITQAIGVGKVLLDLTREEVPLDRRA